MIKYGKRGVHERAAIVAELVLIHGSLVKDNTAESMLLARAINGLIDLVTSGLHCDLVEDDCAEELTEVDVAQAISGMYKKKASSDIN